MVWRRVKKNEKKKETIEQEDIGAEEKGTERKTNLITFPNRAARDNAFDDYEARGIRADAYIEKNGDMRYEECVTGRYLARRDLYFLEVFEGRKEGEAMKE